VTEEEQKNMVLTVLLPILLLLASFPPHSSGGRTRRGLDNDLRLWQAVEEKDLPAVRRLLDKGANVNYKNTEKYYHTPLLKATQQAALGNSQQLDYDIFTMILRSPGVNVNARDKKGSSAIITAVTARAWFWGFGLVELGSGQTKNEFSLKVVRDLWKKCASLTLKNKAGISALSMAEEINDPNDPVKVFLLDRGNKC